MECLSGLVKELNEDIFNVIDIRIFISTLLCRCVALGVCFHFAAPVQVS